MTEQHPIIPPSDLIEEWHSLLSGDCCPVEFASASIALIANSAAQWGADQELEACCALLEASDDNARDFLQSARRPKPPSLKEQALEALEDAGRKLPIGVSDQYGVIRRALEALPDG